MLLNYVSGRDQQASMHSAMDEKQLHFIFREDDEVSEHSFLPDSEEEKRCAAENGNSDAVCKDLGGSEARYIATESSIRYFKQA